MATMMTISRLRKLERAVAVLLQPPLPWTMSPVTMTGTLRGNPLEVVEMEELQNKRRA
ncbi:unnamed protein product [Dovyalis caffra]|uniref:Uncharacterized protein n=1 Tax=Dovyalis caffra TaxID=77055 RepID=A0AAV1SRC0_9ROSI|nr:unnamed protein product [Dovyalis caffra]